jgi:hypothetical protein
MDISLSFISYIDLHLSENLIKITSSPIYGRRYYATTHHLKLLVVYIECDLDLFTNSDTPIFPVNLCIGAGFDDEKSL